MGLFTDTVANTWTDALHGVLIAPLQGWLTEHPWIGWLVLHPLWALAVVGVGLLLFAGLWSAIARLTEGFWLALVRLPFQLGLGIFTLTTRLFVQQWARFGPSSGPTIGPSPGPEDRLSEIMGRLETLQTEQADLLAELHQLLAERQ
jgi:hypothetical protein